MERTVTSVWINPEWFSWARYDQAAAHLDDATSRLYEIHQHACDRLANDPNGFDRVDAIMALRRVVGRRVKELKDIYQLRELPTGVKPKYDLELLEYFGIIRPFMLRQLINIRNLVEHEDSNPPSVDECLMFADLIWYFLRSTDVLVKTRVIEVMFSKPGMELDEPGTPELSIKFGQPFSEPLEINASIDRDSIAHEPKADWVQIEAAR